MDFMELIKKRYSCRKLAETPVEKEKIDKILEAAIVAPTAHNIQPFRIWVIDKADDVEKIKETTPCTNGASLFFVVGAKTDEGWVRKYDQKPFADVDAAIVGTHMMLEIEELGLATTWVGHFKSALLAEKFPQMQGYELIAIFPVGYAAEDSEPIPMHFERKSVDELVEFV